MENRPKLSICIPTYNRAPFLSLLLRRLYELSLPFEIEVIVVDNASDDETPDLTEIEKAPEYLRYYRQPSNVGGANNFIAALRQARGEYSIYLGDDDFLNIENLLKALDFMGEHPEIQCCFAPWEIWDDVDKRVTGQFYTLEEDIVFKEGEYSLYFDFIIKKHIFPEICVFRTESMNKVLFPTEKAFFPFVVAARLLNHGAISMVDLPYYRAISRSELRHDRMKLGAEILLSDWDSYRGGLEYLLDQAFATNSALINNRDIALKMINMFMVERMIVAVKIFISQRKFVSAHETLARIRAMGHQHNDVVSEYGKLLKGRSAMKTLLTLVDLLPVAARIGIIDIKTPEVILGIAKEEGKEEIFFV